MEEVLVLNKHMQKGETDKAAKYTELINQLRKFGSNKGLDVYITELTVSPDFIPILDLATNINKLKLSEEDLKSDFYKYGIMQNLNAQGESYREFNIYVYANQVPNTGYVFIKEPVVEITRGNKKSFTRLTKIDIRLVDTEISTLGDKENLLQLDKSLPPMTSKTEHYTYLVNSIRAVATDRDLNRIYLNPHFAPILALDDMFRHSNNTSMQGAYLYGTIPGLKDGKDDFNISLEFYLDPGLCCTEYDGYITDPLNPNEKIQIKLINSSEKNNKVSLDKSTLDKPTLDKVFEEIDKISNKITADEARQLVDESNATVDNLKKIYKSITKYAEEGKINLEWSIEELKKSYVDKIKVQLETDGFEVDYIPNEEECSILDICW